MKYSLGFIIAISFAGLQFLAILSVVSTSYVTSERAMLEQARELLDKAGARAGEHSARFLADAQDAAELTARLIESDLTGLVDTARMERLLFETLRAEAELDGLFYGRETGDFVYVSRSTETAEFRTKIITFDGDARATELIWRDADYRVIARAPEPGDTFDPRDRPWYINAQIKEATSWTDPYIFFSSQLPGITVSAPVNAQSGALEGVIGADIEISAISEFLSELTISPNGSALILSDSGDVIALPDVEQISVLNQDGTLSFANVAELENGLAQAAFADLVASSETAFETETRSQFEHENDTYVSLVKPITHTGLPWTIALFAPEDDFTQTIKDNRRRNTWIAAAISLATALAGFALAELILKPVRAFAVRTSLVSQGEMSASEPLPRTYKELQRANETLIDEIAQRREADSKIVQLNRDLSHFSRVNLMGQMASGLAHELSQPLTAISQNVDTALTTAKQLDGNTGDLLEILTELDDQAHRGGDIIRALRGFVRKDEAEKAAFDFEELLGQTAHLLHHELDNNGVSLTCKSDRLPMAYGSRVQIAQVLINLIRNAIEAMADQDSPRKHITVTAQAKSDEIEVWVDDTGPGISPDITLFKQFETSKPNGMGLGLAICRTIVEANGGKLWHDSNHAPNSRFCFTLSKEG
jgi:C4-dicarboxylate-specific signal transduction histidine kinase